MLQPKGKMERSNRADTNLKMMRQLRDTPLRTKEDLDHYLRFFYGVYLARVPMEEGNSSPLDFVWDVYDTALRGTRDGLYNFLGVAGRGAQKSLSCGVLETLLLTHDSRRDFFHMASIKQQSKVTYNYVQSFYKKPVMSETIDKCIMSETRTRFDKQLIIGTGTMDSVNSFHGSVIQDEVDLTPPNVFRESKGMLTAQEGKLPLNVCISSRKFAFGNIQELLDKAVHGDYPLKIHKWTILEVTQQCDDERSGEYGIAYYVNEDELEMITEEQYLLIKDQWRREQYKKVMGYEGCGRCGIFSFCQGHLKKQEPNNPFLQPIEQVRNLFFTDDLWFFLSQRLNRKPSSKGMVFPMWEEEIHVKNYEEMYQILTGNPYKDGRTLTLEQLVNEFEKYNCTGYIGVDFGFNCAVCLLAFVDGSDRVYIVDEYVAVGHSDADFAYACNKEWGFARKLMGKGFPDVASPGGIKDFSKFFPMVQNDKEYNKMSKIPEHRAGWIRKMLKGPGTNIVRLYTSYNCGHLRGEMPFYHYKIDPKTDEPTNVVEKKNDHGIDALGNILVGLFGTATSEVNVASDTPSDFRKGELPLEAPTATELADFVGRGQEFVDTTEKDDDEVMDGVVDFDFA